MFSLVDAAALSHSCSGSGWGSPCTTLCCSFLLPTFSLVTVSTPFHFLLSARFFSPSFSSPLVDPSFLPTLLSLASSFSFSYSDYESAAIFIFAIHRNSI